MSMLGNIQCSSLHNFCPLPVEIMRATPDCYKFSAANSKNLSAPSGKHPNDRLAARLGALSWSCIVAKSK